MAQCRNALGILQLDEGLSAEKSLGVPRSGSLWPKFDRPVITEIVEVHLQISSFVVTRRSNVPASRPLDGWLNEARGLFLLIAGFSSGIRRRLPPPSRFL
ncbi:hypothetical protein [Mesorhizobium waimense]|uniref:hypothetical protein n=1 Tax=Mesorhizobium waimense TaxID=1300307 RepID=UPI001FDEE4AC|nr:hypothetical protein [Mesorhizobium waimense]